MRTFFSRDMFSLGCVLILSRPAAASSSWSWSASTRGAAFAPAARHKPKTTTTRPQHRGVCRSAPRSRTNPILEMAADAASGKRKRNDGRKSGVIESVQDFVPPHTALAQVVANQYSIDLRSVSPSPNCDGARGEITVEDVEYYAWTMAQPPCTPEVLEWAYSLGVDLNELYDDEDGEYVMNWEDVRLYEENARSLAMCSQTTRGEGSRDSVVAARRRTERMSALDERIERNVKKLSERAARSMYELSKRAVGGIVQRVQQSVRSNAEVLKKNVAFVDMKGEALGDAKGVEDTDANIGSQTLEDTDADPGSKNADALSRSVDMDDKNTEDVPAEAKEEESSPLSMNIEASGNTKTVEDVNTDLGTQITDALSRSVDVNDNNTEDVPLEAEEEESSPSFISGEVSGDTKALDDVDADLRSQIADAIWSVDLDENNKDDVPVEVEASSPSSSFTREDLQAMSCVELKERLRGRGMKVSGKKADLIDRLLDQAVRQNAEVPKKRVQQAVRQSAEVLKKNIALVDMKGEVSGDTKAVEDVDGDSKSQIAYELSSVNLDENNIEDVPVEAKDEESSPLSLRGEVWGDAKIEDNDADLGSQITDALWRANVDAEIEDVDADLGSQIADALWRADFDAGIEDVNADLGSQIADILWRADADAGIEDVDADLGSQIADAMWRADADAGIEDVDADLGSQIADALWRADVDAEIEDVDANLGSQIADALWRADFDAEIEEVNADLGSSIADALWRADVDAEIEDVDADLGSQIADAMWRADVDEINTEDVPLEVQASSPSPSVTREEL